LKVKVLSEANELVEDFLKSNFVKKPPKNWRWNYIIDIHAKWHHSFFYFIATFRSRGPYALSPTFEAPFTRLEYVGKRRFNMAYVRHRGEWWQIHERLSRDESHNPQREGRISQRVNISMSTGRRLSAASGYRLARGCEELEGFAQSPEKKSLAAPRVRG